MANKNRCRTYFAIKGDFNPTEICAALELSPNQSWNASDLRRDGKPFGFSYLEFGTNEDYDVYTENQMRKTIAPFLDKIPLLNQIREHYGVEFYLTVVPELYVDEVHPCLAPPLDVIDFCHATRTKIDIDLYLYSDTPETDTD